MPSQDKSFSSHDIALISLCAVLALMFSYIEALFPLPVPFPGIKLGLANLVVLVLLYRTGTKQAFFVNVLRILLSGLLFTGLMALFYAVLGGLCSFVTMALLKKTKRFSVVGVSTAGGALHNFGQLLAAVLVTGEPGLFSYFPVLWFAGIVSGFLMGLIAVILFRALPKKLSENSFIS